MTGNAFEYDMLSKSSCCPNIQFDKFHISSIISSCICYTFAIVALKYQMQDISKYRAFKFYGTSYKFRWKIVVV